MGPANWQAGCLGQRKVRVEQWQATRQLSRGLFGEGYLRAWGPGSLPPSVLPGWTAGTHFVSITRDRMFSGGDEETVQNLGVTINHWHDFKNWVIWDFGGRGAQKLIWDFKVIQEIV